MLSGAFSLLEPASCRPQGIHIIPSSLQTSGSFLHFYAKKEGFFVRSVATFISAHPVILEG